MPEFTTNAQQVLKDGKHFADTHSPEDAAAIVRAMNAPDDIAAYLDAESQRRPLARTWNRALRWAAGEIKAKMWEADEPAPGRE